MDFDKSNAFVGLKATDTTDLFRQMGAKLEAGGYVKDSFVDALTAREESFPTGLPGKGWGVGLPHTTPEHVIRPGIAVATLETPVRFKMMGGRAENIEASLVLMLLLKDHDAQICWLQQLMNLIQNEAQMKAIMASATPGDLFAVVSPILQGA